MQDHSYTEKIKEMFLFTSGADSAGAKADAGVYPITVSLKDGKTLNDDVNYNFTISESNGSLTV